MKEIPLTHGYVALVDDEDYERVAQFKWHAHIDQETPTLIYPSRGLKRSSDRRRTTQAMHIFITGKLGIDHADGNGLNNQRSNLRPATLSQNMQNRRKWTGSSRWKGVSWHKKDKCWHARITQNNRAIFLGKFKSEANAAQAYNFAAEELFGEFARLNLPTMP